MTEKFPFPLICKILLPYLLVTIILVFVLIILSLQEWQINGNTLGSLSNLLSISIMCLSFIHVVDLSVAHFLWLLTTVSLYELPLHQFSSSSPIRVLSRVWQLQIKPLKAFSHRLFCVDIDCHSTWKILSVCLIFFSIIFTFTLNLLFSIILTLNQF